MRHLLVALATATVCILPVHSQIKWKTDNKQSQAYSLYERQMLVGKRWLVSNSYGSPHAASCRLPFVYADEQLRVRYFATDEQAKAYVEQCPKWAASW